MRSWVANPGTCWTPPGAVRPYCFDYRAHYSRKVDGCLLLVRKTLAILRASSGTSYLIAADDRRMYALYIDMEGRMETCALIPSLAETTTCKDRGEFDAFVARYMGER